MKAIYFLVCWAYIGLISGHAQVKPPLTFAKKTHDFGTIKEDGGLVSTVFTFENTSSTATRIVEVLVTCGCTSPEWLKGDIAPGDTGSVVITFDPMDRPGHFEKYIRVEMRNAPNVVLKIHGNVTPRPEGPRDWYPFFVGNLWFKQSNMFVGGIYNDSIATFHNVVYNPTDQDITIDWGSSTIPAGFVEINANGKQTVPAKDSVAFDMTYNAAKRNDWGYVTDTVLLVTDDAEMLEKPILASALIKERLNEEGPNAKLKIDKDDHAFGKIPYGSEHTTNFTITNTGDAPLYIRKVKSNCSCITTNAPAEAIAPGATATLEVHLNAADNMGWMRKMLTVITNDPTQTFKNLIIKADVLPPRSSGNK